MTAGPAAGEFDAATLSRWSARLAALSPRAVYARRLDLTHLDVPVLAAAPTPADPLLARALSADPGPLAPLIERLLARADLARHAGGWARRRRERFTFALGRVIPWQRPPGEPTPPTSTPTVDDVATYLAGERWPQHADIVALERPQPGVSPAEAWRRTPSLCGESVTLVLADIAGRWHGYAAGDEDLDPALTLDDPARAFAGFPDGWQRA